MGDGAANSTAKPRADLSARAASGRLASGKLQRLETSSKEAPERSSARARARRRKIPGAEPRARGARAGTTPARRAPTCEDATERTDRRFGPSAAPQPPRSGRARGGSCSRRAEGKHRRVEHRRGVRAFCDDDATPGYASRRSPAARRSSAARPAAGKGGRLFDAVLVLLGVPRRSGRVRQVRHPRPLAVRRLQRLRRRARRRARLGRVVERTPQRRVVEIVSDLKRHGALRVPRFARTQRDALPAAHRAMPRARSSRVVSWRSRTRCAASEARSGDRASHEPRTCASSLNRARDSSASWLQVVAADRSDRTSSSECSQES